MHIFARLAPILYAQSVLSNKISASELSRKFIKSALLVGIEIPLHFFLPLTWLDLKVGRGQ